MSTQDARNATADRLRELRRVGCRFSRRQARELRRVMHKRHPQRT